MTAQPLQADPCDERVFTLEFEGSLKAIPGLRQDLLHNGGAPNVSVPMQVKSMTCAGYIAALPQAVRAAKEACADMLIDRSKFAAEVIYLKARRELLAAISPISARYASFGVPQQRYAAEAMYPGDGGPFGDSTDAHDAEEAEFLISWTMAENAGYSMGKDGVEAFVSAMQRMNAHSVYPEPVSSPEIRILFLNLLREVVENGHAGPALEAALEAARAMGEDIAPPAPKP
jgi:hypothetical protein